MELSEEIYNDMLEIGLNESINFVSKISVERSFDLSLSQGLALVKKEMFLEAINAVEDIVPNALSIPQRNKLYEVLLSAYIATSKNEKLFVLLNNNLFLETEKTPKVDLLSANGHILINNNHDPSHPALPYLLKLYEKFPCSIEICTKLISIGFYELKETGNPIFDDYVKGLIQLEQRNHREALNIFLSVTEHNPKFIPAYSKVCYCANYLKEDRIFDEAAARIPNTDPEVIDLRAFRLKNMQKRHELEQMVLEALAYNKNCPQNWLAFSYVYELKGDISRALHIVSHALRLDPHFRRSYIRQGDLRSIKTDNQRRALESFTKAHQIREGLDTFSAIVHCLAFQQSWEAASTYATAACAMFPDDSPDGIMAQTLLGLAQKGINQESSIAILNKALEKDAENMEALGILVDICVEEEDFDKAIKLLDDHQTPKNDFFYNYKMGEVYGNKRDYETALTYMQKANAIRPTNVPAREMMKQLEQLLSPDDEGYITE